jgi:NADPH2 dehydrogenase
MATPKLFQPIQVGTVTLKHRVVLAPLTRFRGNSKHAHTDLAVEHYAARGSIPGTLIISEASFIAHKSSGNSFNVPGIWSDEQVTEWKKVCFFLRLSLPRVVLNIPPLKVTDAVHAKGSFMYLQLWALGRAANIEQLKREDPSFEYVSSGDVPLPRTPQQQEENGDDAPHPRPLTKAEIAEYVQLYVTAARNAVERAGFDGVEIHGANGYLVDQFLKETSNNRTDEYGGSPENNARFVLDVVAAVSAAVGEERVGLRLSPWLTLLGTCNFFGNCCSPSPMLTSCCELSTAADNPGNDPIPVFSYLVAELRRRHPNFGYLHVVEPRIQGSFDRAVERESNDFLRAIWAGKRWISAGGFSRDSAIKQADERGELIAFGRYFTSNVRLIPVIQPPPPSPLLSVLN